MCRITEQLQLHVKDLKSRQDVLFSDPMKRYVHTRVQVCVSIRVWIIILQVL